MGKQLELGLGIEIPQKTVKMEWSYSRRETLEQCPRRYYYQYYGANIKTAKDEPCKKQLKSLKALSNRHLRTGDIAHLVIRTYLRKLQVGEAWDLDRLLRWAQAIYKKDYEYSLSSQPSNGDDSVMLLEFFYGHENAEKNYRESEQKLLNAIETFITNDHFAPFRSAAIRNDTIIEKHIRLKIHNQIVRGQVDLIYFDGRKAIICDWKIGKANDFGDSLQLLSYALWVIEQYQRQPEEISAYKAYLSDGSLSRVDVSNRNLRRAKARIIQDIEKMQFLDGYGRMAVAEAFTPCNQPKICALCPFQGICPKEGEMYND